MTRESMTVFSREILVRSGKAPIRYYAGTELVPRWSRESQGESL